MTNEEARKYYERTLPNFQYILDFSKPIIENLLKELRDPNGQEVFDFVKFRIKTLDSALEKCERRNLDMDELTDIAGVRIVCPFRDDVYRVYNAIRKMPFLVITEKKDYIKNPKENGYESLHLIVEVPAYSTIHDSIVLPMEIQIRTSAMNLWSSIEHIIKYKNDTPNPEAEQRLKNMADVLKEFDDDIIVLRDSKLSNNTEKTD